MAHNSLNIGKEITLTIDGKEIKTSFGKTILEVARENSIYIPTMCYLTKVKPIASCRMCLVEVDGVDKPILSCQEKAVNGAVITTNSDELFKERQNIMKLYNVNHPLECGVCDQSGECDLQNKTMEFNLSGQNFLTKEPHRPVQNWGYVSYDPSLCIMCEKCVRVSTEITGDEALFLEFGGYSSTIKNIKPNKNYASLGEGASVCPVGALVDTHFKYTTNAWELEKIPSSCTHCSAGCEISYEVKKDKIYRVTNNAEINSLCGAGRYGYDFANSATKNREEFEIAVEKFKEADTIAFSSFISNEEAFILNEISKKTDAKLVCQEAFGFKEFLEAYSSISGKSLYNGTLEELKESQAIIVLGTKINDNAPMVKYHINMASKWHHSRIAYCHPIEDSEIEHIYTQFIKYEAGSEEGVTALLVNMLLKDIELSSSTKKFLDDLDIGNLSAETNVGEEEIDFLEKSFIYKDKKSLVVGEDLYNHPKAKNIAKMVALLEKYAGFNVIINPPAGNSLGVALICDLSKDIIGESIGYNVKGDYVISSIKDEEKDLDIPALSQQEGTITTLNKEVVSLNVASSYNGYILNDIASSLGIEAKYTIDYTKELPTSKGFKAIEFDNMDSYSLDILDTKINEELEEISEIESFNGIIIYNYNPMEQFSPWTNRCELIKKDAILLGSSQFATASKLEDNAKIVFTINKIKFERTFKIDNSLKGAIALNPTFDMGLKSGLIDTYKFNRINFEKIK